jgi:hypothetical protein
LFIAILGAAGVYAAVRALRRAGRATIAGKAANPALESSGTLVRDQATGVYRLPPDPPKGAE